MKTYKLRHGIRSKYIVPRNLKISIQKQLVCLNILPELCAEARSFASIESTLLSQNTARYVMPSLLYILKQ